MVGALNDVQRGEAAELLADGLKQFEVAEIVARPLQEEHRLPDFCQMVAALGGGLLRRMERETKENQSADFGD